MSRTVNARTWIRSAVKQRAGNQCEICGVEVDKSLPATDPRSPSLHHRHRRAKGGVDTVANLIRLCRTCHQFRVHQNEERAERLGWLTDEPDPTDVPLLTHKGWVLLDAEGCVSEVPWYKMEMCREGDVVVTPHGLRFPTHRKKGRKVPKVGRLHTCATCGDDVEYDSQVQGWFCVSGCDDEAVEAS